MHGISGKQRVVGALAALLPLAAAAQEDFTLNSSTEYAGQAIALQVVDARSKASPATFVVSDSGHVPINGGEVQNLASDAGSVPDVRAQLLVADTVGEQGASRSKASMTHLDATVGVHHITALWVESKAVAATGLGGGVRTSGRAQIEGMTVDGQPANVTGQPNQTILLPDGVLVLNERIGSSTSHFGSLTVNGIHLIVPGSGSLIAASAKAEVVHSTMLDAPP